MSGHDRRDLGIVDPAAAAAIFGGLPAGAAAIQSTTPARAGLHARWYSTHCVDFRADGTGVIPRSGLRCPELRDLGVPEGPNQIACLRAGAGTRAEPDARATYWRAPITSRSEASKGGPSALNPLPYKCQVHTRNHTSEYRIWHDDLSAVSTHFGASFLT
jgi:hypothetical protein